VLIMLQSWLASAQAVSSIRVQISTPAHILVLPMSIEVRKELRIHG
jgi:hypothetical protein